MKKQLLESLLAKYITGKISAKEKEILDNWYDSFEMNKGYIDELNSEEKNLLENRLLKRIDQDIESYETSADRETIDARFAAGNASPSEAKTRTLYSYTYRVAAVFIGIILLTGLAYYTFLSANKVVYAAASGQVLHITLPDSSKAVLNGNTTLTYKEQWWGAKPRTVSLDGEAFFSVVHTDDDRKFIVYTSDGVSVEVLGTEFNVMNRESEVRVVLNSGKVRLNYTVEEEDRKVVMKPGELVEFNANATNYTKKKVNAAMYSSWQDKKLTLDRTTLSEVVTMIEKVYGLTVKVFDQQLLQQKVSGTIPAENIDMLLQNIAVPYGIEIIRKEDVLEIRTAAE